MNQFLNGLTNATNFNLTANGALAHKTTCSDLLDMFALGASYRNRTDEDCILLFKNAYAENPEYALKCLFYIRAVRDGQGERRFFRVVYKWLTSYDTDAARRNMKFIPQLCRWDDLFCLFNTPLESDMMVFIENQMALDVECKTPSLLAKWMPSINASSYETRKLANKFRTHLGWTAKQYRKFLAILRSRIKVLECLMSAGKWDEIEFDKLPSKAGFKYRNAFARHDVIKAKYEAFIKDEKTTVNAGTLYPYECVAAARDLYDWRLPEVGDIKRESINKYWDNLKDYFNGATFNGLAVVDVSGSMYSGSASVAPINVAISLGLYCADKAKGPFANHFITFSRNPDLVRVEGVDFCDKVWRMGGADWGMNTNLERVFDLLLMTANSNQVPQDELPESIIVISDMQIDAATRMTNRADTIIEAARKRWAQYGYKLPRLIYWNVNATNNTFLDNDPNATYISGFSPIIFEQLMSGKTGYDLMMEALNKECFAEIK